MSSTHNTTDSSPTRLIWVQQFCPVGTDPWSTVEWTTRDCTINDSKGGVVFHQPSVAAPADWSDTAVNIAASKYFRGHLGEPGREYSVRQMIQRVADTIVTWGYKDGYFETAGDSQAFYDDMVWLLLHQCFAFNSPVWFNLGIDERPQVSACFINSVEDTMDSIMELAATEARLFKGGSGAGVNLSKIRGSAERLTGGGLASGPVSFMRGYDSFAGVVKSGGKTRRAAKIIILDADHPDIEEFISCKMVEEQKAHALIAAGYDGAFNAKGGAYDSIFFQNANHSVRVSDGFMSRAADGTSWPLVNRTDDKVTLWTNAGYLLEKMAEAAWFCGDPGLQFDTTINEWHTCPESGRIEASNPCAEYVHLNDSACNLASLNLMKFHTRGIQGFDYTRFASACQLIIIAQDILVDRASYPTEKIGENARNFRQLGLGYANLGSLLMVSGLGYGSADGREMAANITSAMHCAAYTMSAQLACVKAPFAGYEKNKNAMLKVINKHWNAALDAHQPARLQHMWELCYKKGVKHGFRNSQVTVLAPTGCLVAGTLITTDKGLMRIEEMGDVNGAKWQDISMKVQTDQGPQEATKFYINGVDDVLTVQTSSGYNIRGTPKHQLKVVDAEGRWVWRRLDEIDVGERIPMMMNQHIGTSQEIRLPLCPPAYHTSSAIHTPAVLTEELAELIGMFMANGSLHTKGLRFSIYEADTDVIEKYARYIYTLFGLEPKQYSGTGCVSLEAHSTQLRDWWIAAGFAKTNKEGGGKGCTAYIPVAILASNDTRVYGAFLRGLLTGDGSVCSGLPSFTNKNITFVQEVQMLLLVLGVPTRMDQQTGGLSQKDVWRLTGASRIFNASFTAHVGFAAMRKQDKICAPIEWSKADYIPVEMSEFNKVCPVTSPYRKAAMRHIYRFGGVARHVAVQIYEATGSEYMGHLLSFFYDEIKSTQLDEQELTYDISVPSNVTYVANGFVSHNTIGMLMDCSTTGIEPNIALVSYKNLVGGGFIRLANDGVRAALMALGYVPDLADAIVRHVEEYGHVEGAGLDEAHLEVFDCALRSASGQRVLSPEAHILMMAAVQPFLSGAISKTVNCPNHYTVEDIKALYVQAWKLGLKSIAVYRDGCKMSQPLNTKKEDKAKETADVLPDTNHQSAPERGLQNVQPHRRRLPVERQSLTHKFDIGGHEGYITVGLHEDGTPGEIFLVMAKEGSTISGLMDAFATSISLGLQYGVPLETLVSKFSHTRFEPSGFTGNAELGFASSLIDYIFRWLDLRFGAAKMSNLGLMRNPAPTVLTQGFVRDIATTKFLVSDAPFCSSCGSMMIRSGSCYRCTNCGGTSGCS